MERRGSKETLGWWRNEGPSRWEESKEEEANGTYSIELEW